MAEKIKLLTDLELEELKDKLPKDYAERVAKKFGTSIPQAYRLVRDASDIEVIEFMYNLAAKEKQRNEERLAQVRKQIKEL